MDPRPSTSAAVPRPRRLSWWECPCNTGPWDGCALCAEEAAATAWPSRDRMDTFCELLVTALAVSTAVLTLAVSLKLAAMTAPRAAGATAPPPHQQQTATTHPPPG